MKCYYLLLLLFLTISILKSEIVGVVEIVRHGSRSPPYYSQSGSKYFFDSTRMMLTINGFRQHILLGKWLKERYIEKYKFLPKKFNKNDFKLYSSATQRTIFSLTGHMSGFYPEADLITEYNELKKMKFKQIPPIHKFKLKNNNEKNKIKVSVKNKIEPVLHPWKCKLEGKHLLKNGRDRSLVKFTPHKINYMLSVFKEKLPFISNKKNNRILSHFSKKKFNLVKKLVGYVTCVKFLTNDKNFNFSNSFNHIMRTFIVNKWYSYRLNQENKELIRLSVSAFYENLKYFLKSKSENKEVEKFIIFSGHDTNLIDILSNLINHEYLYNLFKSVVKNDDIEAFEFLVPKFASNILFELHKKKSEFYIKILYNNVKIKGNFISDKIQYVEKLGIPLKNFIEFLYERIDLKYKTLEC